MIAHLRRHDGRRGQHGQGIVEFALLVPVFMILLLGMLEFGFMFDQTLTIQYASREGARVGAALVTGGGDLNDCTANGPWESVDPLIIAAVNRVLGSTGSRVAISRVSQIRIYKSGSAGQEVGPVNVWTYEAGGGPTVGGRTLDFKAPVTSGWKACNRSNGSPPNSIGVSLSYRYDFQTALGSVLRFFGGGGTVWSSVAISDRTVMAMNPTD